MDIGQRLRAIRLGSGLSQRELAKRTGVTNGFISQIENNAVSPSVSSLKKVLDGIPISLTTFFDMAESQPSQVVFRAEQMPDIGSESIEYRLVGHSLKGRAIGMLNESLAPGADTGTDMLCHEGEECGVVIEGEVELTVGDEVFLLGPGDGYYFDSQRPHRFRNIGSQPARLVSANTPPTF
ncbi:cupin domain-containing protein [Ferrimonas marina]|uniref:Transcriptional regulator, contains XRE-family HTH domain n=1 Tax=Ferrimonas marina TaxID=299255 RepID=A0A1M5ZIC7_9GAMM|nr:cupin domain-containing protein [Ferrimonas marina]SHI23859.1 Transcriptional regulator, contains XRE-family HTH domain [Ferrimonas marina]